MEYKCLATEKKTSVLYHQNTEKVTVILRWLNTVLAVCEYMTSGKSWQEKGCSSKAETWQVKNILKKGFD